MLRTCMSTVRVLSTSSLGDLAVGAPGRDEPHDLELAARQPGVLVARRRRAGRAAPRPTRRAPRPRSAACGGQRRGAEPARRARCASASRSSRGLALAGGGERGAGAQQDLRPLERDVEAARAARRARPSCSAAASASPSASAVSPSAWASAASASGWPVAAAIARQRLGARARLGERRRCAAKTARRPAQAPDRVVVVLAALPAVEQRARQCSAARVGVALGARRATASAAALSHAHRDDVEARSPRRGSGSSSGRPSRASPRQAWIAPSTPSATSVASAAARPARSAPRHSSSALVPVAELAQHVGHAAQATLLEARRRRALAQPDRGRRAPRARRRSRRRSRARCRAAGRPRPPPRVSSCSSASDEPGADRLDALVERAALDAGDALEARAPAPAGRSARRASPPRRRAGASRRGLGVAPGALEVAGGDQPLGRRLAGQAVGGVGLGGDAPGGERRARGRPAARRSRRSGARRRPARARRPRRGARPRPRAARAPPRPRSPAQLGVARVALERGEALGAALALGPQLERLAPEARRRRGRRGRRRAPSIAAQQRVERARRVAGARASAPRPRPRSPPRALERLGERGGAARAGAATARRRRSRRARAGGGRRARPGSRSTTSPRASSSASPSLAAERGDEVEVEARARDRGGLGRRARAARTAPAVRTQHRVAHRLRAAGTSASSVELEAVRRRSRSRPPARSARGQLLDEERHAAGAVVQRARRAAGDGGAPSTCSTSAAVSPALERLERELAAARGRGAGRGAAGAAGARAGSSSRAVGGDDEQRQLARARARARRAARASPRRTTGGRRAAIATGRSRGDRRDSAQRIASNSVARSLARRAARRARAAAARGARAAGRSRRARRARARRKRAQRGDERRRTASAARASRRRARSARRPAASDAPRPGGSCPTPASPASSTSEPRPVERVGERGLEPRSLGLRPADQDVVGSCVASRSAGSTAGRARASDGQLARAGAVEHRRDLGDEVRGEPAAARVLEDVLGVLGLVDAVDLVAGDVAVQPRVRPARATATASLDVLVIPRSSSSVSLLAPGISRSMR